MNSQWLTMRCITNLHAGSGEAGDGVIDLMIQRDVITQYPEVHASSLKGALREHINSSQGKEIAEELFGNGGDHAYSSIRLLPAQIFAIPLRSMEKPYVFATTFSILRRLQQLTQLVVPSEALKECVDDLALLTSNTSEHIYLTKKDVDNISAENLTLKKYEKTSSELLDKIERIFGTQELLILNDLENAEDITHLFRNMPVIARNVLENGRSKNLWYEEFVPRESVFILAALSENPGDLKRFCHFVEKSPIQVGANATVGYGYVLIQQVS